jgi:hypothetical protein
VPVIGLGASAPSYYGAVGDRLGCQMILPEHAGVANAIGAVAGQVSQRRVGLVSSPAEGRFVAHLADGLQAFSDRERGACRRWRPRCVAEHPPAPAPRGRWTCVITGERDIKRSRSRAADVHRGQVTGHRLGPAARGALGRGRLRGELPLTLAPCPLNSARQWLGSSAG